jgi:hypothetical protein
MHTPPAGSEDRGDIATHNAATDDGDVMYCCHYKLR